MADFRKCDGNCEACGKCRGERLLRELRSRKSELTYMPEGFRTTVGDSTADNETADGNGSPAPGSSFANRSETGASESGDRPGSGYGIAFDIGTTTVVGLCWDLAKRELLATDAARNPQVVHGGDVISRIGYSVREEENLEEMRQLVIDCLNEILDGFLEKLPVRRTEITEITAVGNTTMSHLLLGEDPEGLAVSPFRPAFKGAVRESAAALGLRVPAETEFYLLPGIAGHVGSDITAGLLALDLENKDSLDVFVDIGTNGEVAVTEKGRILVCSTAAGPAFEGAAIRQGMRATEGAIEGISLCESGDAFGRAGADSGRTDAKPASGGNGADIELKVIGDVSPAGICGSGLIDAVSVMLSAGLMDRTGRILTEDEALSAGTSPLLTRRLVLRDEEACFVLQEPDPEGNSAEILLRQSDIREVQLAKSAIVSGILALLKKSGHTAAEADHLYLAGAFGNYIRKEAAVNIGLLPDISPDRIIAVGNAAGVGASLALFGDKEKARAERIAASAEHVELAGSSLFYDLYIENMNF